jgi:hypothetical protein
VAEFRGVVEAGFSVECSTIKDTDCKDAMKSGDSLPIPSPMSARRVLALLALCSAAFTLVGSLVTIAEVNHTFDWVPGSTLLSGNPLVALDEMLAKLVLFGLGGALVMSAGFDEANGSALVSALCVGLSASAACEVAQLSMAGHTPCITGVILGGVGALGGARITIAVSRANRKAGVQTNG